jgi:hypothetical protein
LSVPRRRWLLRTAVALAALLTLGAIGIAIYTADPVRVVALLQKTLRRDFGLSLAYEGTPRLAWWPHPGVALEGYRIDVIATSQPLAWGDALAIDVPWRALTGGELAIERIALDGPVFNAGALKGWTRAASDGSPPRWPVVGSGIVVRGGTVTNFGGPPRTIIGIEIMLSAVSPGRPLEARIEWSADDASPAREPDDDDAEEAPVRLVLDIRGTPRNAELDAVASTLGVAGLTLDDATLALSFGDAPPITFRGAMAYAPLGWALDGTVEASKLPTTIASYVVAPGTVEPPTSLALRVTHQADQWTLLSHGNLAEAAIDADLDITRLPDFGAPLPQMLEAIRRDVQGTALISRLRIGEVVLDGIELGDAPATAPAPADTGATAPKNESADD